MLADVTIATFTHNRQYYLQRMLSYYKPYGIKMIIADSSEQKPHLELIDDPNVTYCHLPEYSGIDGIIPRLKYALSKVETKYTAICADDDFAIPNSLNQCAEFLDENADYTAASGNFMSFRWEDNKVIWEAERYANKTIDQNTARERFITAMEQARDCQLVYCLCKTDVLQEMLQEIPRYSRLTFIDYYMVALHAIHGKVKFLPICYGAREMAANTASGSAMLLGQIKTSAKYQNEYQDFSKALISAIAKMDSLSEEEVEPYFIKGMDAFFAHEDSCLKFEFSGSLFDKAKETFPRLLYLYRVIRHGKNSADRVLNAKKDKTLFTEGFLFYNEETRMQANEIEQWVSKFPVKYHNKYIFKIVKRRV